MLRKHDIEDLVGPLERDGTYRVLRKVEVANGRTDVSYHGGETLIAVAIDVETTGLDVAEDEREEIDFDDYPPRRRGRLMAYRPKARPVSEDFWGVLHRLIVTKPEAELLWGAYQRWVKNNRPRPPRP